MSAMLQVKLFLCVNTTARRHNKTNGDNDSGVLNTGKGWHSPAHFAFQPLCGYRLHGVYNVDLTHTHTA